MEPYARGHPSRRAGNRREALFAHAALIYGIEILDIFAILFDSATDIDGENVAFYLDNNNSPDASVSNAPGPPVITAMAQLLWCRIAEFNMAAWSERVPSKKNIADLPTKRIPIPFPSLVAKTFRRGPPRCLRLISSAGHEISEGRPAAPPRLIPFFFCLDKSLKMVGPQATIRTDLTDVIQSGACLIYLLTTGDGQTSDLLTDNPDITSPQDLPAARTRDLRRVEFTERFPTHVPLLARPWRGSWLWGPIRRPQRWNCSDPQKRYTTALANPSLSHPLLTVSGPNRMTFRVWAPSKSSLRRTNSAPGSSTWTCFLRPNISPLWRSDAA